jgi:hypothetical protein
MAVRLPDFTSLSGVETGARNVPPSDIRPNYYGADPEAAALAEQGASLGVLGTGLEKTGTGLAALESHINLANGALAQLDLHTKVARTKAAIDAESDPAKIDALYSQLPGHLESAGQLIPNQSYREAWKAKHGAEVVNAQLDAEKRQRTVYDQKYEAGALQKVDDAKKRYAQSEDPAAREQALNDLHTYYGSFKLIGGNPAVIEAHERTAAQDMIMGRSEYLYSTNRPKDALDNLMVNINKLQDTSRVANLAATLRHGTSTQTGDDIFTSASTGGGAPAGGGWKAPPGPAIEGANPAEQQIGNEIRHRENSGDYGQTGRSDDNGGGAYQFRPSTWKEATRAAGIGTEYERGGDAPQKVQDAVFLSHYRKMGIKPWEPSGPYPQPGGTPTDIAPLVTQFHGSLNRMVADAAKDGVTLIPGQLTRSYEDQKRLWEKDLADHGGQPSGGAAFPGTSQHGPGLANDVHNADGQTVKAGSVEDKWIEAHRGNYNIVRPVAGEPWHLEPVGGRAATRGAPIAPGPAPPVTVAAGPAVTATDATGAPILGYTGPTVPGIPALGLPDLGPEAAVAPAAPALAAPAAAPISPPAPIAIDLNTPEGRYADTLAKINADPRSSDPAAHQRAVAKAEAAYHAENMRVQGALHARNRASDIAADSYVKQMMAGKMDGIIETIGQDPRLNKDDRKNLWKLADEHMKNTIAGATKDYGPGYFDVVRRITLPDDAPGKLTGHSQILALGQPGPNGEQPWLTPPGVDRVMKELNQAQHSTENHAIVDMKNKQLDAAKQQLMFPESEYLKDFKGRLLFDKAFTPAFYKAYEDGIRANKTPYQLLTPGSPDYITDKLVATIKRNDAQMTQDRIEAGDLAALPGRTEDQIRAEAAAAKAANDMVKLEALRQEALRRGFVRPGAALPITPAPVVPLGGAPQSPLVQPPAPAGLR